MLIALLFGFGLAFVGSIPFSGPIAVLVLALGMAGRPREAIAVAIGASVAEAGYAGVAFVGVEAAYARWPGAAHVGEVLGGLVVVALGGFLVRNGAPELATPPSRAGSLLLGFGTMASNLSIPLQWSAVCAAVSPWVPRVPAAAPAFGLGVGLGAFTWFSILTALLRRRPLSPPRARLFVRACGVWLAAIGVWMLVRVWR
ncbi:MAG: hypothetical protein Q8P41_28785 [Pseudomonadota bacterium]|nr:hypothetical protein [Pseudomonadota bacterium]